MKNKFLLLTISFLFSIYGIAQAPVKAPKKNGLYELKEKHELLETGKCENGFKSGTWQYFKYGRIQKEEDFDDKGILLVTRIFRYDGTGSVEMFSVVKDIYEGEYSKFYFRENPLVKGWYTAGKKNKTWSHFRKLNGNNLWKDELWVNDALTETQFFYTDGKLFKRNKMDAEGNINSIIYYDKEGKELATLNEEMVRAAVKADSVAKNSPHRPPPPPPGQTKSSSADTSRPKETFTFAETMPEFPGGVQTFLQQNIRYPVISKEAGRSGTVWITFIVNKYGDVESVYCKKGVPGAKDLEEEAIRVIQMMAPFSPGSMNGKPVRIEMTLPVKFMLQ
jgi:TonB family protein